MSFLCYSQHMKITFFSPPAHVEMAINADGSQVFAVIFLTVSSIDFLLSLSFFVQNL